MMSDSARPRQSRQRQVDTAPPHVLIGGVLGVIVAGGLAYGLVETIVKASALFSS